MVVTANEMAQQPAPEFRLPGIISDHLVLQSGQPDPIWGWAHAGAPVQVEFLDGQGQVLAHASSITSVAGKWALSLPPLPPGSAGQLRVTANAAVLTVHDVLVGETWLAAGQSNMGYVFHEAESERPDLLAMAKKEAAASHGMIRSFTEWNIEEAESPQDDLKGSWTVVTPDEVQGVSCVAWSFAMALREKLDRPVGLLISARSSSLVEQWMSKATLDACSTGPQYEKRISDLAATINPRIQKWRDADTAWLQANPTPELQAQKSKTRPVRSDWLPPMFNQLYNSLIHPMIPYGIKGVLWFQGDGDQGMPEHYGELLTALIKSWRQEWQVELPFYYVEGGAFGVYQTSPVEINGFNPFYEQEQVVLKLPKVDVANISDLESKTPEVHFPNKIPVGQRLALLALNDTYGITCEAHSPAYESFKVAGNKIRLKFTHATGLRVRGGGALSGFAIRGTSGDWTWAKGEVDGQDVLLWNVQVPAPAAVRYAWSSNPIFSMENGAGLPMRPFRTDVESPQ